MCVNFWHEAQLRWRLRDADVPRRAHGACRLDCKCAWKGEKAKANSYAVATCKGEGNGACRQASQKAALAAKAHLDATDYRPLTMEQDW